MLHYQSLFVYGFSPYNSLFSLSARDSHTIAFSNVAKVPIKYRHLHDGKIFQTSHSESEVMNNPLTVGVVGATGAVGKEIIGCLNKSSLYVDKLRIFGSHRSAGTICDAGKFGGIEVEMFDIEKSRECDVVFLAVSGDFSLQNAKKISDGSDGAVVIDNSVSIVGTLLFIKGNNLNIFKESL